MLWPACCAVSQTRSRIKVSVSRNAGCEGQLPESPTGSHIDGATSSCLTWPAGALTGSEGSASYDGHDARLPDEPYERRSGQSESQLPRSPSYSLSRSRSGQSESQLPSALLNSRSTLSLDGLDSSCLSQSFLSQSSGSQKLDKFAQPIATKSVAVQADSFLPLVCARCSRPPRPPRSGVSPQETRGTKTSRFRGQEVKACQKLTQFSKTPRRTQTMCILQALERVNVQSDGDCCRFHATLGSLARVMHEMGTGECDHNFLPLLGWQCGGCLAMNGIPGRLSCPDAGSMSFNEASEIPLQCSVCGDIHAPSTSNGPRVFSQGWPADLHQPTPQQATMLLQRLEEAAAAEVAAAAPSARLVCAAAAPSPVSFIDLLEGSAAEEVAGLRSASTSPTSVCSSEDDSSDIDADKCDQHSRSWQNRRKLVRARPPCGGEYHHDEDSTQANEDESSRLGSLSGTRDMSTPSMLPNRTPWGHAAYALPH